MRNKVKLIFFLIIFIPSLVIINGACIRSLQIKEVYIFFDTPTTDKISIAVRIFVNNPSPLPGWGTSIVSDIKIDNAKFGKIEFDPFFIEPNSNIMLSAHGYIDSSSVFISNESTLNFEGFAIILPLVFPFNFKIHAVDSELIPKLSLLNATNYPGGLFNVNVTMELPVGISGANFNFSAEIYDTTDNMSAFTLVANDVIIENYTKLYVNAILKINSESSASRVISAILIKKSPIRIAGMLTFFKESWAFNIFFNVSGEEYAEIESNLEINFEAINNTIVQNETINFTLLLNFYNPYKLQVNLTEIQLELWATDEKIVEAKLKNIQINIKDIVRIPINITIFREKISKVIEAKGILYFRNSTMTLQLYDLFLKIPIEGEIRIIS